MNKKWNETHNFRFEGAAVAKFRRLMREKIYNEKRKAKKYEYSSIFQLYTYILTNIFLFFFSRDRNEVTHLLRRYPNLNKEFLSQKYPSVDIKKLIKNDKIKTNVVPQ